MKVQIIIPIILATLSFTVSATNLSLGQNEQSDQAPKQPKISQPGIQKTPQTVRPQTPSPVGGAPR